MVNTLLKKIRDIIIDSIAVVLIVIFYLLPGLKLKIFFGRLVNTLTYYFLQVVPFFRRIRYDEKQKDGSIRKLPDEYKTKEICLPFSGGTDSTLTAYVLASQFKKVHLVTFQHSGHKYIENSSKNVVRIKKIVGSGKIIHTIIDIDRLFKRNFMSERSNLIDFNVCHQCRLAMFMATLQYCRANNIKYVTGGETTDPDLFQSSKVYANLQNVIKMYKKYHITYVLNPSRDIYRPDVLLFKKQILPMMNVKNTKETYKCQPECAFDVLFEKLFNNIMQ